MYFAPPKLKTWLRVWQQVASSLGGLQHEWPWSAAASHSLMHFINRCTWKVLLCYIIIIILMHFINRCTWKVLLCYIIIIMMASFVRLSLMLVFHKNKCVSAIKPILFNYHHIYILVFFHVFVCSLPLRCMPNGVSFKRASFWNPNPARAQHLFLKPDLGPKAKFF